MASRLLARWRGLVLALMGIVATVWLGVTGQLGLYIHPRYYVFTVVMAVIGGVLAVAAFALAPADDDHDDEVPTRGRGWWTLGGALLIVASAVALLALPPATLSAASATDRDVNSSDAVLSVDAPTLSGDYGAFTIKDWAALLRSPASAGGIEGERATLTGFVTADETDPDDVFYVTRFVVTCCAVDAQPVGVPVYLPGWQEDYPVETWVEVEGAFATNPSVVSSEPLVVVPSTTTVTEQPAEPYVF